MVMKLSPHTRVIMATPVGQLSERVMYSHVTPCSARLAIIWSPNESAPTAPSMHTAAPIFAAATAWFAPLPPGLVMNPRPIMVSPKLGMWSLSMDRSMFRLPKTMTLLMMILRVTWNRMMVGWDVFFGECIRVHWNAFDALARKHQARLAFGEGVASGSFCLKPGLFW